MKNKASKSQIRVSSYISVMTVDSPERELEDEIKKVRVVKKTMPSSQTIKSIIKVPTKTKYRRSKF